MRDPQQHAYESYLRDLTGALPERVQARGGDGPGAADESGAVVALRFRDLPEPGIQTVFTYGLSRSRQAVWTQGRPEVVLMCAVPTPGGRRRSPRSRSR